MSHNDAIRVPPHNDEAERSTIGAALIDNRMIQQLAALAEPQDFYRESHRHIWRAICALDERGEAVDVITLSDQLAAQGLLEQVGGPNVLARLSSEVPSAANSMFYAQIVKRKAQLRAFIAAAYAHIDAAYEDLSGDAHDAWCAKTASELTALLVAQHGSDTAQPSDVITREVAAHMYHGTDLGPRWDTPFPAFNAKLENSGGRFTAGQLIVVGARPGGGKTAWALQVALHNACAGHNALFFSMEMTRVQLALRMLACHARVDAPLLTNRTLSERQWSRVTEGLVALREARIWIDERCALTVAQIEAECARLASVGQPPAIVVVDYLQLVRPPTNSPNKADQLDQIAQGLHEIAQRQRCVVIALAQLNRSSAGESNPGQGSFKGSGGIEAAADVAMVLWRDEGDGEGKKAGAGEVLTRHDALGPVAIRAALVKNRSGSTGPLEFDFHGAQYRFVDPTAEDDR